MTVPDHNQKYEFYDHEFGANNFGELLIKLHTDPEDYDGEEKSAEVIWKNFMDADELKVLDDKNFDAVNRADFGEHILDRHAHINRLVKSQSLQKKKR